MTGGCSSFLGIDVGTSGVKAVLVDSCGTIRARCTIGHPISTPKPLWSEQDPVDWWSSAAKAIATVLSTDGVDAGQVGAVGLTGQMHGLVLLDKAGDVLRPAILWNDQRSGAQCDSIHERVGAERVINITGKPVLPGFTAPKLEWVRTCEPEVYENVHSVLLPKDYVRFRLTGQCSSDVADASGTSWFDIGRRNWSDEIVDVLNVPLHWLPSVSESPDVTSFINAEGARATGLLEGTPVVAGAGDQAAEAVGCGIVDSNSISVAVGTSGVVFGVADSVDAACGGTLHGYCHAVPGAWHVMGVMLAAGGSLGWYRGVFGAEAADETGTSFDSLMAGAANVDAGCEGLFFLPYLSGERSPHPDPLARGAFVGLTMRHSRDHLTRSVLEGVAFGLRDSLELARAQGMSFERIRVSGGGVRSDLWRQIMADVFNAPVCTVNVSEGAAFGAAVLAMVGGGAFKSCAHAASSIVREVDTTMPGDAASIYALYYQHYCALYPTLAPTFHQISSLVSDQQGAS